MDDGLGQVLIHVAVPEAHLQPVPGAEVETTPTPHGVGRQGLHAVPRPGIVRRSSRGAGGPRAMGIAPLVRMVTIMVASWPAGTEIVGRPCAAGVDALAAGAPGVPHCGAGVERVGPVERSARCSA